MLVFANGSEAELVEREPGRLLRSSRSLLRELQCLKMRVRDLRMPMMHLRQCLQTYRTSLNVISMRPEEGSRRSEDIMEINFRDIIYAVFFLAMAVLCAIDVWVI